MDKTHFNSPEALHKYRIRELSHKGLYQGIRITRTAEYEYVDYTGKKGSPYEKNWMGYSLTPLPGCCGVLVSHEAYVSPEHQDKGLGEFFHKERLRLMEDLGYSCGLCTTVSSNTKENHILEKNGWRKVYEFVNSRTKNIVFIWVKDIKQDTD